MDIEARVTALETRLRAAEDQLEIFRLIFTYGPLVDSDETDAAVHLWIEGGIHDVGGYPPRLAYDGIADAIGGAEMQALNRTGCTHFYSAPRITLSGDEAEGVAYSLVVIRDDGEFRLWRTAVNYWTFVRTAEGWRIKERFNRLADGGEDARRLMRKALA